MGHPPGSLSELLNLPEALPAGLVDWTGRIAAHAKSMTVWILHIHFPYAPGHVGRRLANDRTSLFVVFVKSVYVLHEDRHPYAGLSLPPFAEKNLDLAARDTDEARRIAPVPLLGETQLVDVVVHGRGEILDVQDGNHTFKCVHLNSSGVGEKARALSGFGNSSAGTSNQDSLSKPGGFASRLHWIHAADGSLLRTRVRY